MGGSPKWDLAARKSQESLGQLRGCAQNFPETIGGGELTSHFYGNTLKAAAVMEEPESAQSPPVKSPERGRRLLDYFFSACIYYLFRSVFPPSSFCVCGEGREEARRTAVTMGTPPAQSPAPASCAPAPGAQWAPTGHAGPASVTPALGSSR